MTANLPAIAEMNSSWIISKASKPLWTRLADTGLTVSAVDEIAGYPELHEEALALLPMLERALEGCGSDQVKLALQPLVLVFGLGSQAKASAFWSVYTAALSDLPAWALAAGIADYVTQPDAEFFPRPGPLRALASKHAEVIWRARTRASMLSRRPVRALVSPEEAAVRKRLVSETLEKLSGGRS